MKTRKFEITFSLRKILKKLSKKDKVAYRAILKKIDEVLTCENVAHYKNLRYDLKSSKRVHIKGHFVLVFSYDPATDFVCFENYDHHDKIYK